MGISNSPQHAMIILFYIMLKSKIVSSHIIMQRSTPLPQTSTLLDFALHYKKISKLRAQKVSMFPTLAWNLHGSRMENSQVPHKVCLYKVLGRFELFLSKPISQWTLGYSLVRHEPSRVVLLLFVKDNFPRYTSLSTISLHLLVLLRLA